MTREFLLPGIEQFDQNQLPDAPALSGIYQDTLSRLVLLQDDGVTHFYGSELDIDNVRNVWMSPVEVDDGESHSYFQILYVNTTPEQALGRQDLPVSLLEIDEASYKLTPADHPGYQQLMSQFTTGRQHVLIRHCNTGMAYYPRAIIPGQNKSKAEKHLEKLIAATGLHEPEVSVSLSKPSENEGSSIETSLLHTVHARKYPFGGGEVHSYGLVMEDDPWGYYEVFTPKKIERMSGKDMLVRIDSGCDSGQIFDDCGCDCREQLHTALADIQQAGGGAVIHIPSQDGRGFGAATKMETESLKRGIPGATNKGNLEPVDTITAARNILGENFDIRTYQGAGRLLGMLGVDSILLQTDNRVKAESLAAGGIQVTRKPTNTCGANGCSHHVEAKHQHATYFGGEEN